MTHLYVGKGSRHLRYVTILAFKIIRSQWVQAERPGHRKAIPKLISPAKILLNSTDARSLFV